MKTHSLKFLVLIVILLLPNLSGNVGHSIIPHTGSVVIDQAQPLADDYLPTLTQFTEQITAHPAGFYSGVYVPNVMAYPIIQQPADNAGYVSTAENTITQFRMASQFDTIGLLAHNTLAGADFYNIQLEDVIYLVLASGELKSFSVTEIQRYQALNPSSPYSDFRDLDDSASIISAQKLFMRTYARGNILILQTCIEEAGNSSWGRLFIIAEPFTPDSSPLTYTLNIPMITFLPSGSLMMN